MKTMIAALVLALSTVAMADMDYPNGYEHNYERNYVLGCYDPAPGTHETALAEVQILGAEVISIEGLANGGCRVGLNFANAEVSYDKANCPSFTEGTKIRPFETKESCDDFAIGDVFSRTLSVLENRSVE